MNALKKKRVKAVLKYTWPFYIIGALLISFGMIFIFGVTHKVPNYKTLTIFISGQVKDSKKLKNDMLEKYKDNELRSISSIFADPSDASYYNKLSVAGYNSSDVLIITETQLNKLNVSAFALDLSDAMVNSYYSGMSLYAQNGTNFGVEIDRSKVSEYFYLPDETCYMVLNGKSVNTGEYSPKQIKEHDNALRVVRDWGK